MYVHLWHLAEIAGEQESQLQKHHDMLVLFLCFSTRLLSGQWVSSSPSTNLVCFVKGKIHRHSKKKKVS